MSGSEWTFAQEMALERMSGALSIDELVVEIALRGPHHNARAITVHASQISISLARRRRCDPWDDEQDGLLRALAGEMPAAEIAGEIRRRLCWLRTTDAVEKRAERHGVSLDVQTLCLRAVAGVLAVRRFTVQGWMECRYLVPDAQPCLGQRGPLRFRRAAVVQFVRDHPHLVQWQRVRDREIREIAREAHRQSSWLTVAGAARMLGIRRRTIQAKLAAGEFDGAIKVGRSWRIPAASVSDVARARRKSAVAA